MRLLIKAFIGISLIACSGLYFHLFQYHRYGVQLLHASLPGEKTQAFVRRSANQDPALTLANLYFHTKERWAYKEDSSGRDDFASAETLLASPTMRGDCEDFAAVLMACCRVLELDASVCLGTSEAPGEGPHAWLEVLMGKSADVDAATRNDIKNIFEDKVNMIDRNGFCFLQMEDKGILANYRTDYRLDQAGVLEVAYQDTAFIQIPDYIFIDF